jgi:hypothetical protein
MEGGQWLVTAVKKCGVNERGEKLRLNRPLLEALQLIGDFRIASTYMSGGAQIFKTLSHWQLVSALITIGRHDFAWIYPQMSLIPKLVPSQFKPIVTSWEAVTGLDKKQNNSDSKSMQIHQSAMGTGRFASANNDAATAKSRDGTASANTNVVSFSSDLAIYEERSQYTAKSVDAIRRRFLQSRIATRPERLLGTPGNGGGIEMEISKADYEFHAHVKCSSCSEASNLSPLGWLLIPNNEGEYFDEGGRPLDWHGKDEGWARFGCPHCSASITKQERMDAHFKCVKTGVVMVDFLNSLPSGVPTKQISAGIILSPLLRDSGINPAIDLIQKGSEGADVADWHQQELGIPTKFMETGISVMDVAGAVGNDLSIDVQMSYLSIWGVDQGTAEHWLCMVDYQVPPDSLSLTNMQIYERSIGIIKYIKSVRSSELSELIINCDGGAIDNEPGRDYAAEVVKQHASSFAFDQRGGRELGGRVSKMGKVEAGGEGMDAVLCDTHRLQDMIMNRFKSGLYSLPAYVDSQDTGTSSATRHLTTSSRDPETGRWSRPIDHKDDLLKALMACELWYYLHCIGELPSGGVQFGDDGLV